MDIAEMMDMIHAVRRNKEYTGIHSMFEIKDALIENNCDISKTIKYLKESSGCLENS